MVARNVHTPKGERKRGASQALVRYSPVNLADVVNRLTGIDVKVEPQEFVTIDQMLEQTGLPVYVEPGWLSLTRERAELPPWLGYDGQKKVGGIKQDATLQPAALDLKLKGEVTSLLRDAQRIGSKEPTLEGGAFVYRQIMDAYARAAAAGIDLFHYPSLREEARSPVNWFIRGAFTRARTYFAKGPDLAELMRQLLVPSAIGYMFGAKPTSDFHSELVPIFEERARTAKRQANARLQERDYTAGTLKPISDVVSAAEMYGVRIAVQFR